VTYTPKPSQIEGLEKWKLCEKGQSKFNILLKIKNGHKKLYYMVYVKIMT
jgi:hypothetical protein